MGSIVYCIHHKDGCKWSDELRKLKVICIFFFKKLGSLKERKIDQNPLKDNYYQNILWQI